MAYKGTRYHGWQLQQNANTVQSEVNKALQVILQSEIETIGCGRTDTGVHASEFYLHFDSDSIIPNHFINRLNKLLPKDIAVYNIFSVAENFHSRFDAISRTYIYIISKLPNPFESETSWHHTQLLDIEQMNKACDKLKTYSDFQCFSKVHTDVNNFNCTIGDAFWYEKDHHIYFEITANRFLRNMVRAIVGTMIEVGTHKITLEQFSTIIESKNRQQAGVSVPAHGLFLKQITYPEGVFKAI